MSVALVLPNTRSNPPVTPNPSPIDQYLGDTFGDGTPIYNPLLTHGPKVVYATSKWSWAKFAGAMVIGFLTGGPAGAVAGGLTYGLTQLKPPALPAGELETITSWFSSTFVPYFNTVTAEINTLLEDRFGAASIGNLNLAQQKLCLLKSFYQNVNSDSFLSQEGLNFRYSLIEPFLTAYQTLLHDKAASINAGPTTTNINYSDLKLSILPIGISGVVQCTAYVIGKTLTPVNSATVEVVSVTPAQSNPTTVSGNTTDDNDKKHPLLYIGGTILTLWGIKELFFSKSKPKSN